MGPRLMHPFHPGTRLVAGLTQRGQSIEEGWYCLGGGQGRQVLPPGPTQNLEVPCDSSVSTPEVGSGVESEPRVKAAG